ncbi:MAG: hypothetical protein WA005_11215 [Candidatus Binataceae bacterium]
MRRLFSKADLQALSSALALVLLSSSVPLTAGVVVVCGSSHPEFTVNICQPIQMFDRVSNTLLARSAVIPLQFGLFHLGSVTAKPSARIIECKIAPDTPPPRRLV